MQVEQLQGNWVFVAAYMQVPKLPDGRLQYGEKQKLMSQFNKTKQQAKRLIQLVTSAEHQGITLDLTDRRKSLPGPPSQLTPKIEAAMKQVNKQNLAKKIRTTRRRMVQGLKELGINVPLSTVHRYILELKGKLAKWHVKVLLTEEQMDARLEFVEDQVIPGTERFKSVENQVHVDEKWFYLIMEKGYLLVFPEDELPSTYAQHKNNILKVMFLCAVCKPQRRPDGSLMNGLIACEPFTEVKPAARGSKNRAKGTLEENSIKVSAEVYRKFMKEKVIPKIRERLKWKKGVVITIRHDGAKPHNGKGNKEFFEKWGRKYGWIFEFERQSPQSPDVNVLDIGVFNGLQAKSDEYRMNSSKVLDMVAESDAPSTITLGSSWTTALLFCTSITAVFACVRVEINIPTPTVEFVAGSPRERTL